MKNILFVCALLAVVQSSAQEFNRLSFSRFGLFYEAANQNLDDSKQIQAAGFEINVNPMYNQCDEDDPFVLGWSLNLQMGWNFTNANLAPYVFDIGIWGAYLLNDNIEVGLRYDPLGIYGYQYAAQFGSSLSPAIRAYKFQLVLTRAGEGVFYGCFIPKSPDNFSAQHSAELSFFLTDALIIGARYTNYKWGGTGCNEWRFSLCVNMGEMAKR